MNTVSLLLLVGIGTTKFENKHSTKTHKVCYNNIVTVGGADQRRRDINISVCDSVQRDTADPVRGKRGRREGELVMTCTELQQDIYFGFEHFRRHLSTHNDGPTDLILNIGRLVCATG